MKSFIYTSSEKIEHIGLIDNPDQGLRAGASALNEVVRAAAQICESPIAVICLTEDDCQNVTASFGLTGVEPVQILEFCERAIRQPGGLIIETLTDNTQLASNSDSQIRLFCGISLQSAEGVRIGTLGVFDVVPHQLTDAQVSAVRALCQTAIGMLEASREKNELQSEVNELKKKIESLKPSEERYRAFVEHSSEAIWCCEFEIPCSLGIDEDRQIEHFYQHGFIIECNDALAKMYGFGKAQDFIGGRLADFLVRSDPANVAYLRAFIRSDYRVIDAESSEVDHEGRQHFFLNNLMGIVEDGALARVWGTQRDITERKRMEIDLKVARDAALESVKLKSQFLANMSHEIRTPMNGVIGMTELLLNTSLDEEQKEFAQIIRSSAESLLTIINDILDLSKLEAGKLQLEVSDFEPQSVVMNTVKLFLEQAHSKGLELTSHIAPDVPTKLCGDQYHLRQVFTNLLSNAVKFTEQGSVNLRVTKEYATDTHTTMRVTVNDTGIGIPEESQSRIFLPFIQSDGSMTRRYGGTGLGLAISKQLIELMGGVIGVESLPGKGSSFWFTVCLKNPADHLAASTTK
jgi:PAS domain S-box-containing protein